MAGREHEAHEIVADVMVERGVEIRRSHLLLGLDPATELRVLALEQLSSAQEIDRSMFHGDERVLRERDLRFSEGLQVGKTSLEVLADHTVHIEEYLHHLER